MTTRANLSEGKPGDVFHFSGDWQTEPGDWRIDGHDEMTGQIRAVALSGPMKGTESLFWPNCGAEWQS